MIIIGTNDVGPMRYLLEIDKYLMNSYWVASNTTKPFLKQKKLIKNWKEKKISLVITGTSVGYKIDKKLIEYSKKEKIASITIVESWGNFKERFFYKNNFFLSDYIILNDIKAYAQAINVGIPKNKIFIGGNPILEKLSKYKIENLNKNKWLKKNDLPINKKIVSYISEPFHEVFLKKHKFHYGFDEYSCLSDLKECLDTNKFHIIIKKHPSDSINKYEKFFNGNISLLNKMKIDEIVNFSDYIIGMSSFLILKLTYFRDDVVSYMPNSKKFFICRFFNNTINLNTKNQLFDFFKKNTIISKTKKSPNFKGSLKKILKFIEEKK